MLLSVRDLELRKASFHAGFEPGKIDLSESKFRQATVLRVTGTAELVQGTDEIRVRGRISGELEGDCDRCLEAARLPIGGDFDLCYRPEYADSEAPEAELDEGETEIGFYEGTGLQLADVVREQILLWLPMRWICDPDCKGICPICGGNRNKVSCGCREQQVDDRWAALRDYRPSSRK